MPVSDQQRIFAYHIAEKIGQPLPELKDIPSFIEKHATFFDLLTRIDRIKEIIDYTEKKGPETNYFIFRHYIPSEFGGRDWGRTYIYYLESELHNVAGLYAFLDENGTVLYIGKSKNLAQRIPQSYGERWANNFSCEGDLIFDIRFYVADESDIGILEMYLISKYKPKYNKDGKTTETTKIFESDLDVHRDFISLPCTMEKLEKISGTWRDFKEWLRKECSL